MKTNALLLSVLWACLACFGGAVKAQQDQPQRHEVIEGLFRFFDAAETTPGGVPLVGLEDGRAFALSEEALAQLQAFRRAGPDLLVSGRTRLRLGLDGKGRVAAVDVIGVEEATPRTTTAAPGRGSEIDRWASRLRPGAVLELDVGGRAARYRFVRYAFPDLFVADMRERGAVAVFDVRKVRAYRTIAQDARQGSGKNEKNEDAAPQSFPAESSVTIDGVALRPGLPVEIDGERGFIVSVKTTELEMQTAGGKRLRKRYDEISEIRRIPLSALQARREAAMSEAHASTAAGARLQLRIGSRGVNASRGRYVVSGTVRHEVPGKALVGAQIQVHVHGEQIVPPARYAEISREQNRRGMSLSELARIGAVFEFDGIRHRAFLDDGATVVVQVGAVDRWVQAPLGVLFPKTPLSWQVATDLYPLEEPNVVVNQDNAHWIAFSDPRAVKALVHAYEHGGEEQRRAALEAMAASSEERFLGLLLWHAYLAVPERREPIERAFQRFGERGKAYLVKQWREGPPEAIAVDLGDRIEERSLRATAKKTTILRLLERLGGTERFVIALSPASDPAADEEVRERARAVFYRRPSEAVAWLVERLVGQQAAQAASVLMLLQERDPETLPRLYESLGLAKRDPENARELERIGDDMERSRRYLRAIMAHLQADKVKDAQLATEMARAAAQELVEIQEELRRQGQRLADVWIAVSKAPPVGDDARHWEFECLLRALALFPKHAEARRRLAELALEVGEELREGLTLRNGPGLTYRSVRTLRTGEILADLGARSEEEEGVAAAEAHVPKRERWLHVRVVATGERGWVPARFLERLSETGDYRVREVEYELQHVLTYLEAARMLDRNVEGRLFEALAQVHATQARAAAERGDWREAFEAYRAAARWQPQRYRRALAMAFVRANAAIPGLALVCLCGLLFAGWPAAARRGRSAV